MSLGVPTQSQQNPIRQISVLSDRDPLATSELGQRAISVPVAGRSSRSRSGVVVAKNRILPLDFRRNTPQTKILLRLEFFYFSSTKL